MYKRARAAFEQRLTSACPPPSPPALFVHGFACGGCTCFSGGDGSGGSGARAGSLEESDGGGLRADHG